MIQANEPKNGIAIELTPLIDMVFLLLIFFLVATTFHQTEREMQIALPAAASAGPITTALREIVINVDQDGQIIVGGRRIEPDDLRALVTEAVAANPEQKVTVRGDRTTAYANIVRVLDICKGAGIQEPYLDTVITEYAAP
ncbi:MAG: biopolymer transporter ExbD [Planctomycetota bacterium]|nr:biopolymer transporter ExbD [Planctomycetota bacterium]